jgi:hypothetical protein
MVNQDHCIGITMVRVDRGGPWAFERAGQALECVCDEVTGIVCRWHAEQDVQAP